MQYMWELAESMGIEVTHVGGREYGTERYELTEEVKQPVCENCDRTVRTLYPVHCTEADPTQVDYHWCRVCINAVVEEDEEGVPF